MYADLSFTPVESDIERVMVGERTADDLYTDISQKANSGDDE